MSLRRLNVRAVELGRDGISQGGGISRLGIGDLSQPRGGGLRQPQRADPDSLGYNTKPSCNTPTGHLTVHNCRPEISQEMKCQDSRRVRLWRLHTRGFFSFFSRIAEGNMTCL